VQGLLQRIEHDASVRRPGDAPADDTAGVGVDDQGHIDEAGPGVDISEIREPHACSAPEHERSGSHERAWRRLVLHRRSNLFAADHPFQAHLMHQPGDGAAGHVEALPPQLPPDLAHAIDPEGLLEDAPNLDFQRLIPLRPGIAGKDR